MLRVFNCGVGMAAVVAPAEAAALVRQIKSAGVNSWQLGEIIQRKDNHPVVYA